MTYRLALRRAGIGRCCLLFAATLFCSTAVGDVLLDEAHTVAGGAAVDERAFSVSQSGSVEVDVADLAFPAALASMRVAVTQGATLVAAPLVAPGKIAFTAAAGSSYQIRIVGRPDPTRYAGSVGVNVVRPSDPTPLMQYVASLQLPGIVAGLSVHDEDIVIPEAGTYTFTLADHGFPAAFPHGALYAVVFYGSQPLGQTLPGQPLTLSNLAASVPGSAAQYKLTVVAQADPSAARGLYGLTIAGGPSSNVVFDRSLPVGLIEPPQGIVNASAGAITLQVTDLAFPAPLSQLGVAVTAGGTLIGSPQFGSGPMSAAAPAGPLQLWRVAQAGAAGGSYLISVANGATTLYADARGVAAASTSTGGTTAYTFPFNLAAAGGYTAEIADFQFPAGLQTLQFAVVQNGAVLQSAQGAGSLNFNGVAGAGAVLVLTQPQATGAGLFGVRLYSSGASATSVLDTTQAVGTAFDTRPVIALAAGRYDVTVTDAGWPARFQSLSLALTRGGQVVGKIFAGGTFAFDATPGVYQATFIAGPAAGENAGLYSIRVASSVPTVTLSADATQVQSGQGVRLTWSAIAASSCAASGAWSGSEPTTGTAVAVGPLTTDSTFTLTCSGPGGTSAPASVSVKVTATPSSGGGGGEFSGSALAMLGALLLGRVVLRRSAAERLPIHGTK